MKAFHTQYPMPRHRPGHGDFGHTSMKKHDAQSSNGTGGGSSSTELSTHDDSFLNQFITPEEAWQVVLEEDRIWRRQLRDGVLSGDEKYLLHDHYLTPFPSDPRPNASDPTYKVEHGGRFSYHAHTYNKHSHNRRRLPHMPDLVVGPWVVLVPRGTPDHYEGSRHSTLRPYFIPTPVLQTKLCPLIKYMLSNFVLLKNSKSLNSLGYCFSCFRARSLLTRFRELMIGKRLSVDSKKPMMVSFARLKNGEEMVRSFGYKEHYGEVPAILGGSSSPNDHLSRSDCSGGRRSTSAQIHTSTNTSGWRNSNTLNNTRMESNHDIVRHCFWFDHALGEFIGRNAEERDRYLGFYNHFLLRNKYIWSPAGQARVNRARTERQRNYLHKTYNHCTVQSLQHPMPQNYAASVQNGYSDDAAADDRRYFNGDSIMKSMPRKPNTRYPHTRRTEDLGPFLEGGAETIAQEQHSSQRIYHQPSTSNRSNASSGYSVMNSAMEKSEWFSYEEQQNGKQYASKGDIQYRGLSRDLISDNSRYQHLHGQSNNYYDGVSHGNYYIKGYSA